MESIRKLESRILAVAAFAMKMDGWVPLGRLTRTFDKVRGTVAVMRESWVGFAVNGKDLCLHKSESDGVCVIISAKEETWLVDVGWFSIMVFFGNVGLKSSGFNGCALFFAASALSVNI
ncbi:hypothetical protein H0G86_012245 [Trichoderma simmonsii]|uniref:Uncharacterized protein n=1 Tax=Trichoderma simmonsii TaxID=1491479 RepID=A0A8G0LT47_9HYPO|nr:hypothetical protein H0G86_012245 [Trichoderma simmonsii]